MKLQRINNKKVIKCRSCPEVFCKKDIVRNFAKFTGKQLFQSLFLMAQVLSCDFCEILKNTFSYRKYPVAASENGFKNNKAAKTEYIPSNINTRLE